MEFIFIMTIVETGIALIVIVFILILAQFFGKKNKSNLAKDNLRNVMPVKAKAIILNIEKTALTTSQRQQVKMQVQVMPERGRNFVTEIKELLTWADFDALKSGTIVSVFYNPVTMKEVTLIKTATLN